MALSMNKSRKFETLKRVDDHVYLVWNLTIATKKAVQKELRTKILIYILCDIRPKFITVFKQPPFNEPHFSIKQCNHLPKTFISTY